MLSIFKGLQTFHNIWFNSFALLFRKVYLLVIIIPLKL